MAEDGAPAQAVAPAEPALDHLEVNPATQSPLLQPTFSGLVVGEPL